MILYSCCDFPPHHFIKKYLGPPNSPLWTGPLPPLTALDVDFDGDVDFLGRTASSSSSVPVTCAPLKRVIWASGGG